MISQEESILQLLNSTSHLHEVIQLELSLLRWKKSMNVNYLDTIQTNFKCRQFLSTNTLKYRSCM